MPQILRTAKDSPYDVELAGVGVMGGNGKGGIPVERAAKVVAALQDDHGEPLTGKKLSDAAQKLADDRGLDLVTLKGEIDEEKLRVEGGAFPRGLTIEEISNAHAERERAQVEEHVPALRPSEVPAQDPAPTTDETAR